MERVNLIPDDLALTWGDRLLALVNRRFVPVLGWTVASLVVTLGAAAVSYGVMAHRYTALTAGLERQRATLTAAVENDKAFVGQLDRTGQELRTQLEALTTRIGHLARYREQPGEWAQTLQDIKRALPYGVWLTEMETSGRGAIQLRLAGGAFNDDLVSRFMSALKATPRFANVAFNFTKQGKIGKTGVIEFEIACQLLPTAQPAS